MRTLQLRAGIDAQFVGDPAAEPLVPVKRVGMPAGPVQREHQQLDQPFPDRVISQQTL
jgi:hypothetical protein